MTRPEAMLRAETMVKAGWTFAATQRYLANHGVTVTAKTIHDWVDPEFNEQRKTASRIRKRRKYGSTPRLVDEDAVLQRALTLNARGLDPGGVRIVLSVDFGFEASTQAVREMVRTGTMPERLLPRVVS